MLQTALPVMVEDFVHFASIHPKPRLKNVVSVCFLYHNSVTMKIFLITIVLLFFTLSASSIDELDHRTTFRRELKYEAISKIWYKSPMDSLDRMDELLMQNVFKECELLGSSESGMGPCVGYRDWWKHPWDAYHRWCTVTNYEFENPGTEDQRNCLDQLDQRTEVMFANLTVEFKDTLTLTWVSKPHYPTDGAFFTFNLDTSNTSTSDNWYDDPVDQACFIILEALMMAMTNHGFPDSYGDFGVHSPPPENPTTNVSRITGEVYSGVDSTATIIQSTVLDVLNSLKDDAFRISNVTMENDAGQVVAESR